MADDQSNDRPPIDDTSNVARDTDGRGSANANTDAPTDPNVEAVTNAFEGQDASAPAAREHGDGPDAIDLEDMSGASRREPGR